jgi:hypothetical protein
MDFFFEKLGVDLCFLLAERSSVKDTTIFLIVQDAIFLSLFLKVCDTNR